MNTLTLLLLLGDLAEKLDFIGWLSLFIIALFAIVRLAFTDFADRKTYESIRKINGRMIKFGIPLALVLIIFPSKKTIYLAAASEVGEEVVTSEAAQKLYDYLDALTEGFSQ